jgi:hypothetical protein
MAFRNGFAPVKIFNAIPSPFFSAAPELRPFTPHLYHSSFCSRDCLDLYSFITVVLNTSSPSDSIGFPRRTDHPVEIFNGRFKHPQKPHLSQKWKCLRYRPVF